MPLPTPESPRAPLAIAHRTNGQPRTDRLASHVHRDAGDSHDLIRVHGARENNLKDASVEIPKRRLTGRGPRSM